MRRTLPHRLCGLILMAALGTQGGGLGTLNAQGQTPAFAKHVIDSQFPAISAVAADVDGDGKLDVIAAGGPSGGPSKWSNLVQWYRAPDWKRQPVVALDAKAIILHIDLVNFTERSVHPAAAPQAPTTRPAGDPQIMVTDGQLGEVWWVRGADHGRQWSKSLIVNHVENAHGAAAADIDGDGFADVLVPTQRGEPKQGMLWAGNPSPGTAQHKFWPRHPLAPTFNIPGWQHYVRLVDLTGSGRMAALLGSDGDTGWFGYWQAGADPTQPWECRPLAGPMRKGTHLDAADLDGDGRLDLIAAEGHGVGLWWFPEPDFKPVRIDDTLRSPHCLAIGDFDGDGRIDLASCGFESRQAAVFYQQPDHSFRKAVIDSDQCAYDLRAVDLDGDGDLDLLLSGQNSENLVWYENRSPKAR